MPPGDPLFVPSQLLAVAGGIAEGSARVHRLELAPRQPLSGEDVRALIRAFLSLTGQGGEGLAAARNPLSAVVFAGIEGGTEGGGDGLERTLETTWEEACLLLASPLEADLAEGPPV